MLFLLAVSGLAWYSKQLCHSCHQLFSKVSKTQNVPLLEILDFIGTQYCTLKKLQDHRVCKGAVREMTGYISHSLWARVTDPHQLCHRLQMCPKEYFVLDIQDFRKEVMKGKPNKTLPTPSGLNVIKVGHISDLHVDFKYVQGAPQKCNEPVCCRNGTKEVNGSKPAGKWGSIAKCDLPLRTFQLFADTLQSKNTNFVLWTGDNTAHDIWSQSQPYNNNFTISLSKIMQDRIEAPVIPAAGNHQSFPVNVYDFDNDTRQQQLKTAMSKAWQPWIGKVAAKQLTQNLYYSLYFQQHNLRACNDMNWFLLRNPTDPGDMISWLLKQLKAAQQAKQLVWIIGHIPPDCLLEWSDRYNILVERFQYTIRGQFFGHTHSDHFFVFRSGQGAATGTAFVSPSLTTYSDKNPQFRVMEVDSDTMQVLDYHQYHIDLRKANDPATFELFYSLRQAYNLSDASLPSMDRLQQRLKNDTQLQKQYTMRKNGGLNPGYSGLGVYCGTMGVSRTQLQCLGKPVDKGQSEKFMGPWKQLRQFDNK